MVSGQKYSQKAKFGSPPRRRFHYICSWSATQNCCLRHSESIDVLLPVARHNVLKQDFQVSDLFDGPSRSQIGLLAKGSFFFFTTTQKQSQKWDCFAVRFWDRFQSLLKDCLCSVLHCSSASVAHTCTPLHLLVPPRFGSM